MKVETGRLWWINSQHLEKLWGSQAGHSALLRAFKEGVERCYGARSALPAVMGVVRTCTLTRTRWQGGRRWPVCMGLCHQSGWPDEGGTHVHMQQVGGGACMCLSLIRAPPLCLTWCKTVTTSLWTLPQLEGLPLVSTGLWYGCASVVCDAFPCSLPSAVGSGQLE